MDASAAEDACHGTFQIKQKFPSANGASCVFVDRRALIEGPVTGNDPMMAAEGQLLRWIQAGADAADSNPDVAASVDIAVLVAEYSSMLYRVGVQHEEMVMIAGGLGSNIKLGSRIPVSTVEDQNSKNVSISYIDIGLNISAHIFAGGTELSSDIEQSSIDGTQKVVLYTPPIIRQSTLRTSCKMIENTPVVMGSLDLPGSDHHLKIEVTMSRMP